MLTGLEVAGVIALGKKALETVIEDIYKSGKDATQKALKKFQTQHEIGTLFFRIANVRQVKTLWQVDKAVDLSTFYCESHVLIGNTRIHISSLSDFGTNESLLIEGIAGQGKSIFLRYLCAVELTRGQSLPVFLELRRIQPNQTLLQAILIALQELGFDLDESAFREICSTGKIVLLLDGFDEVHDDMKSRITVEIEHLGFINDRLRMIVSSRLDSGLTMCAKLRVCKLCDLQDNEYQKVIYKLLDDTAIAKQLIDQVEKHPGGLKQLLSTPLMVTLLVLGYKSYQELPAQLSDFYDSLFQVLLQRHDGVKPGWKRARGCLMNDYQYRKVFEAFCFYVKQSKSRHLDDASVHAAAERALQDVRVKEDAGKFISDILKITCLLVKDGAEHRFIHKSVQEFYAASFIASKPEIVVKDIYKKLFSPQSQNAWQQEVRFLSEIDPYRYNKYGLIPALCEFFNLNHSGLQTISSERIMAKVRQTLEYCGGGFVLMDGDCSNSYWFVRLSLFWPIGELILNNLFGINTDPVKTELLSSTNKLIGKPVTDPLPGLKEPTRELEVTYDEIYKADLLVKEIDAACDQLRDSLLTIVRSAVLFVEQEEQQEGILKLLD